MKTSTLNRWLKPLAILLVIVLIVMLLIPAELTNARFAQIKPGMTMTEVKRLLGKPSEEYKGEDAIIAIPSGNHVKADSNYSQGWYLQGRWGRPSLSTSIPREDVDLFSGESSSWVGKTHLFIVVHKNGIVIQTWMYPLTREGGCLEGFIKTLREYWNKWRK